MVESLQKAGLAEDTAIGGNLNKRSFTVVVERDPESNWLVGEIVGLPGCYTQAPDLPALEANIGEAIQAYK